MLLTRIVGLRSFSKMTTFDFVMTVAMGSLLAGAAQATEWRAVVQAGAGMAGLFAVQWAIARARHASDRVEQAVQNTPVILMRDGKVDEEAMRATRVAYHDLVAKLRAADVKDFADVRFVVLETTGDISVMQGGTVSRRLLDGTRAVPPDT